MRNWNCRADIRMDFSRHQALVAFAETNKNDLTGAQFHHAETTQRFHMDENIFRPSPRVRKPKPLVRLNHLTITRSRPLDGVTVT